VLARSQRQKFLCWTSAEELLTGRRGPVVFDYLMQTRAVRSVMRRGQAAGAIGAVTGPEAVLPLRLS